MQVQDEPIAVVRTPQVNARLALTLLVLINLFNYIDRQVFAAVEKQVSDDLFGTNPDEAVGVRMGALQFAFLISYMLLSPLFGFLADRMSRWRLIALGVILWSLASGASGISWTSIGVGAALGYWLLFLTRCFVGVGEAAYGPVAPAMIADLFPVERRGKVMAWFYLAIPVGGALGYVMGGQVKTHLGPENWHWAFYLVVPPGLLLGLWSLFMPDPPRAHTAERVGVREALAVLKIPSYTLNTAGMTMMTFAIGGLAFWMPRYLEQNHVAAVGPIDPATFFGVVTVLAGLVATLTGGMLGDALRPRFSGAYFLVSGAALILGFPMVVGFLLTPFPYAWGFVFGAVFCLFFNTGPTNTILANVTHPAVRASAFALNILMIHLFGDAISPLLIGWIGDTFRTQPGELNLAAGFAVMSVLMFVGGVIWLAGAPHLERDTELAPTRL